MRRLLVLPLASALALLAACGSGGAGDVVPTSAARTSVAPTTTTVAGTGVPATTSPVGGRVPQGFRAVTIRLSSSDGVVREWCVFLADTPELRARGLMKVDTLGGYDGMLFRFGEPSSGAFYMFQTVLALSIAFFDDGGGFVSSTDMAPCTEASGSSCPLYTATGPYTDAVEVVQGDLGRLGALPGSRLEVTDVQCAR